MCFMIAAGKKATIDGSTFVARSCDSNPTEAQRIISEPRKRHQPGEMIPIPDSNNMQVPQVEETYAYTAVLRIAPTDAYPMNAGGINEFQVSVGASTGGWVKDKVAELTPWPDTVIGDYTMTLALERCKTAREAIEFLGQLTEKYGGRTDNYIVGDPNEVWMFEQYHGYHWAASRVPDDCFVVQGNSYRIGKIDPEDTDNYRCDPDLIPFATKHGFWDPDNDPYFHASRTYGTLEKNRPRGDYPQPYYSLHRVWRANMLLKPSANLDLYEPTKEYPLFLEPDEKLTVDQVLEVLKDYYQGTELDEYGALDDEFKTIVDPVTGHYRYSPAWTKSRIIGCPQAVTTWLTQSRSWLPNEIGGVLWAGLAAAASSPHIPFYAHNTRTPKMYRTGWSGDNSYYMPDSAYWLYENIGNLMNLFYQATVDLVKPVWTQFDKRSFYQQQFVEDAAMKMHAQDPKKAVEFLTTYSNGIAQEGIEVGTDMLRNLNTRIALTNNPQTSRAYEDPKNWKNTGFIY